MIDKFTEEFTQEEVSDLLIGEAMKRRYGDKDLLEGKMVLIEVGIGDENFYVDVEVQEAHKELH